MANEISKIKLPGSTTEYIIKDNSAITDITRDGTTFTATKRDGTTFTFTQQDNNTTYTLAVGTGDDANKIVLTPSSGTANKITVPYATSATSAGTATKATQDGSGNVITSTYVKKSGDTMTGALIMAGNDIQLRTSGSSSDDSSDITWYYGNGLEKCRLWTSNSYTSKAGLNYRLYNSDGNSLYNGTIPLADGTGASGTWNITAATANKLGSSNVGSATKPIYLNAGTATACTYTLGKSVPSDAVFTDYNVKITKTNPSSHTWYYPVWYQDLDGGTTKITTVNVNDGFMYHCLEGTQNEVGIGELILGNDNESTEAGNKKGALRLYSEQDGFVQLTYDASSRGYSYLTLPSSDGTILTTGTTSFTQSLSSGTKIGTIKINNVSTDLYCQTNTNNAVTQTATSTSGNYEVLFSATADNTTRTEGARKNSNLIFNPTTGLKIGSSTQSAFPTTGIQVHDVRSVNFTPGALDQGVNFFFSNNTMPNSNWWSGIHVKGWTGAYAAWEIVGSAHNNDSRITPLYVRTSNLASTWGSWRKIYDTSNPPTKSEVGLGNVDNTADANKSVSYATTSGTATGANKLNSIAAIGTASQTHAEALKTYFDANKTTIPRNVGINFYSSAYNNGANCFGYFLNSYDDNPYGGFFISHYDKAYYVGINNGNYTQNLLGRFTADPTSGQVVVTDGTTGGIKSSGYTIAKSVPSNAVFTDVNVKVNNTNPTTGTWYYPVWYTATSGTGNVNANDGFKHYSLQGTASAAGRTVMSVGNNIATGTAGNKYGEIWIYAEKAGCAMLKYTASATESSTHTFPTTGGTILNTGTTSFTQSLSSGTKIGTIKINGTSTDLYCQTNTNNAVTQTATTTSANYELLFSATADNTTRTEGARKTDSLKYNPSTKEMTLDGTIVLNGYSRATSTDPCPSIILKANNIDTDTAVSTRTYGNSEINAHDMHGDRLGFINWFKDADGSIGFTFAAQNKSTDGNNQYNTFDMRVDKTGNRSYSITDPSAFRTAINTSTITFTKTMTAMSGTVQVWRRGNTCTINIGNQVTTTGTYQKIGDINPKPIHTQHFIVAIGSRISIARVNQDGSIQFNNNTTVNANEWVIGSCTYITAD